MRLLHQTTFPQGFADIIANEFIAINNIPAPAIIAPIPNGIKESPSIARPPAVKTIKGTSGASNEIPNTKPISAVVASGCSKVSITKLSPAPNIVIAARP